MTRHAKWLLWVAAAWNFLGGASALVDPAGHFSLLYASALNLDDPLQLFFFRCTWINVMAWGVGYGFAALDSGSSRAILRAGAAGKLVYFGACASLYLAGVGKVMLLASGVIDVVFAVLFLILVARRE